jgi:dTDP-4-dehydrorhamnose reductase
MNILLAGSSGQLGQELSPVLASLGAVTLVDRNVSAGDRETVKQDLAALNRVEILLNRTRPDIVVNAAAYTAVDQAENDTATAFRLNAELPGCLARWCERNDRLMVHYSTDYVFPGNSDRPYRETDPAGPLNVYGESKLAGELAVSASGCRHIILRTSWVYSTHGNNFVLTMLRLARERPELNIVSDQKGCPTWARNLARVTGRLISQVGTGNHEDLLGLYHYCDSGVVNWYDFAHAIFSTAQDVGLLRELPRMTPVQTSAFPQLAERPLYSVLDSSAVREAFGVEAAGLNESLQSCLEELKESE